MKDRIQIDLLSHARHLNQILTGYHRYSTTECQALVIEDHSASTDGKYGFRKTALIVTIDGKKLVYDMADGYQSIEIMHKLKDQCNYYFKRSFSAYENERYGLAGIAPLGMNYDITWSGNPLSRSRKLGALRTRLEALSGTLITPEYVAQMPDQKYSDHTVLFSSRLWTKDEKLTDAENDERMRINASRIALMRRLKKELGSGFVGGLEDSPLTRTSAPDLVLPKSFTNRNRYLEMMRKADICIGTAGLHKSTGWKMGEYVAASRAIVCERPYYSVPGDFSEGENYYAFNTADQCVSMVMHLLSHPEAIYAMKCKNHEYYMKYLEPEQMIRNTLSVVEAGR